MTFFSTEQAYRMVTGHNHWPVDQC